MENSLAQSSNYTINKSKTNTNNTNSTSNRFIVERFKLDYEHDIDLNNAIIDNKTDISSIDCDYSDKLQVCQDLSFTINDFNSIFYKSLNKKRLKRNKYLHQITYKINNSYNNNNGNNNENDSNNNNNNKNIDNYNNNNNTINNNENNNNNNNNKNIDNYNNNNNTINNNENNNKNDNENNNNFINYFKTEDQKKYCSEIKNKNKIYPLSIEERRTSNKIFNLIISGTILN